MSRHQFGSSANVENTCARLPVGAFQVEEAYTFGVDTLSCCGASLKLLWELPILFRQEQVLVLATTLFHFIVRARAAQQNVVQQYLSRCIGKSKHCPTL